MSEADVLLAQHQRKIAKVGQWIAVRRYTGTAGVRTYTDIPAKAFMAYKPAKEFVGAVIQNYATVIALADTLNELVPPISTNDKLITAFSGSGDLGTPPSVDGDGHVSGGKESAIFSVMKRNPGGKLIAYEILAVG